MQGANDGYQTIIKARHEHILFRQANNKRNHVKKTSGASPLLPPHGPFNKRQSFDPGINCTLVNDEKKSYTAPNDDRLAATNDNVNVICE